MGSSTIANRGPYVENIDYAFLVLTTLAVVLRFYDRYVAHKAGPWWDDWLSLVALVSDLPHHRFHIFDRAMKMIA